MPRAIAENTKDQAIQEDRKQIEGRWNVISLVVNGKEPDLEDVKKLTVVNQADGTWKLLSAGEMLSKGTSSIDPMKTPKTIDFTVTEGGGAGNQHRGIYELGKTTRKMCFAPVGKDRPAEFASTPGSEIILVTFEREKGK